MTLSRMMTLPSLILACALPLCTQQEEPIRETVSVINVEVPVRVFAKGEAVAGLRKEDFRIFEDGKPQPINGFYSLRKKIAELAGQTATDSQGSGAAASRYFILVYRLYEYNPQVQDSLDYLFRALLRPDDQLLVFANDRHLSFPRVGDDDQAQARIGELLKNESRSQYVRLQNYLQQIEASVNITEFNILLSSGFENLRAEYIQSFLQSYLEAWRDFKRNFLLPSVDRYYYFARHLEKVRKPKWVLNFYQLEQFPQIAFSGRMEQQLRRVIAWMETSDAEYYRAWARSIHRQMILIDREMKVADDFPAAEVSKLFYKVNATFHSFFMRISKDTGGNELQFRQVASDMENSLRELTERTGGSLIASNNVADSLGRVAQLEDTYYVLTYEPSNPKKVGRIKVTVSDRKCDVLYDDNIRADYIAAFLAKKEAENPAVRITGLSFQERKLSLGAADYARVQAGKETTGRLQIRIRIKNAENQTLFDQAKELNVQKDVFSLTLSFDFLPPGKYDVIVDLRDLISGKSCTEALQPLVE